MEEGGRRIEAEVPRLLYAVGSPNKVSWKSLGL
jgi:hypothetical protein